MEESKLHDFDQEQIDEFRKEFDPSVEDSDEFKENMKQSLIWDITRHLVPEGEADRDVEAVVEFSNYSNKGSRMKPEDCLTPAEMERYNKKQELRKKLQNLDFDETVAWATEHTALFKHYRESTLKYLKLRAYRGLKMKIENQLRGNKSIN